MKAEEGPGGRGNYMLPQLTGGGKQVGGKQVGGKVREERTTEKNKVKAEEGPGGRGRSVSLIVGVLSVGLVSLCSRRSHSS